MPVGTPIVIFNSLAHPVTAVIHTHNLPLRMTDDAGMEIPIQRVRASKTNLSDKYDTAFQAHIPPLGYTVYRMYFDKKPDQAYHNPFYCTDTVLENECLRAEFSNQTGELCRLYHKQEGRELLDRPAFSSLVDETHCDTWAHDVKEFKNVVATCQKGKCKLIESGPVRAVIRTFQTLENTTITRDYILEAGSTEIKVKATVDFREKHRMLKFSIPVQIDLPQAIGEIPFGFIQRPTDGTEQVCGSWICMQQDGKGLALASDSKYSFDADAEVLSMTVLRGAIYADHYGMDDRDDDCVFMEQGIHVFSYTIFPFVSISDAAKKAQQFNNAPVAVGETFHNGDLPTMFSGIAVSEDNIVVTAVKQHEDGEGVVLRCYEAENRDTDVKIQLLGQVWTAHFGHNQVKTFWVQKSGVKEVDFMEWERF